MVINKVLGKESLKFFYSMLSTRSKENLMDYCYGRKEKKSAGICVSIHVLFVQKASCDA